MLELITAFLDNRLAHKAASGGNECNGEDADDEDENFDKRERT